MGLCVSHGCVFAGVTPLGTYKTVEGQGQHSMAERKETFAGPKRQTAEATKPRRQGRAWIIEVEGAAWAPKNVSNGTIVRLKRLACFGMCRLRARTELLLRMRGGPGVSMSVGGAELTGAWTIGLGSEGGTCA